MIIMTKRINFSIPDDLAHWVQNELPRGTNVSELIRGFLYSLKEKQEQENQKKVKQNS
jgi:Arc/MetJ-type ribon-helix-helix transcriptional regulator